MFFLECDDDNSLLIKKNDSVICDHDTVAPGNVVAFFHNKTKYHGKVRMIADEGVLKREIEKIRLADKQKNKVSKTKTVSPTGRRLPKRKLQQSPKLPPIKITKLEKQKIGKNSGINSDQRSDENDTDDVSDDSDTNKSASQQIADSEFLHRSSEVDEVNLGLENPLERSPLKELSTTPSSSRRSRSSRSTAHSSKTIVEQNAIRVAAIEDANNMGVLDDDDDDEAEKEQLYSSLGTENMKHIGNGIYCKTAEYKNAVKGTPSATAVARNLLIGVFKKEVLVQGSVAGRSPRAQGPERMKEKNIRLHDKATQTIIKFAKDYAKKKNWSSDASDSKIKSAMAQRIVELKGEDRKNSLRP